MMTAPHDRTIDVNGLALHYLDWGNDGASPMLLLHGFSGHAHTWDTFARAMSGAYRVLALDQRGHGDSGWAPGGAYSVDDHAGDVRAFHDRLGLGPLVLVGLSMGGRNAIRYTATNPGKVARLVIVDIGPDIASRGAERVRRTAAEAPEDFGSVDEAVAYLQRQAVFSTPASAAALRARVEHGLKRLPDERYTWKYDKFLRDQRRQGGAPVVDLWPSVRQITVPTLIVRGAESDVFSPETSKRMVEVMPDSRFVEIPGAGHSVPADAPEAFERAVREFLSA
jgi:pimeloyl-ACP methyl ester carboxylesterase